MAERPIIFSGPMVRAILEGRKTQTRRVVTPQPRYHPPDGALGAWCFSTGRKSSIGMQTEALLRQAMLGYCPYGLPGDTLWVRETHAMIGNEDGHPVDAAGDPCGWRDALIVYRADVTGDKYGLVRLPGGALFEGPWCSPIYMRREHSRLSLRVVRVRVERLQEIQESDAVAEGVTIEVRENGALDTFRRGWDSINGKRAPWSSNPWVWVVEFERVPAPAQEAREG